MNELKIFLRQARFFTIGLAIGSGLVAARYEKLAKEVDNDSKFQRAFEKSEKIKYYYGHKLWEHHINVMEIK